MSLTVAELLKHAVFGAARPQVLTCVNHLDAEVRWVHTSEIYEIGSLLKGGEVLLTTGLGLVGKAPAQVRTYVDDLAGRGVACLMLELGRTFTVAPPALVEASERLGLPLVALHGVVPFVEVTEQIHHLLIDREVTELRRHEEVNSELVSSLLSGAGVSALVRRIADLAGCPATLVTSEGHVLAASHPDDSAEFPASGEPTSRTVEVFGVYWGRLILHGPGDPNRAIVLDRGRVAVSLELVRSGTLAPARQNAQRGLMRDIATGRYGSAADLTARAEAVGFAPRPHKRLVAVCVGLTTDAPTDLAVKAAREAARHVLGSALVADVDGVVMLAGTIGADDEAGLRLALSRIADSMDRELALTAGGRAATVVAGPVVNRVPELVRSAAAAREGRRIASHLGHGPRVLLSSDVGVHRLLARLIDDPEFERFIGEQIGSLLEYDARHGRQLVRTLDEYLNCSLSKARTAEALGIRRQTLYARLERISELLDGLDLDQRERRSALDLALTAWRLRTSGMPR